MVDVQNQYDLLPSAINATDTSRIVHTRKNLGVTSPRRYRRTCSVLMIICTFRTTLLLWFQYVKYHSDLEDSHVIPGLIHKCYLAKSELCIYCSSYVDYFLPQRMALPLLFLAQANRFVNSSILMTSPSYSSGCCENTMMSSQSYFLVCIFIPCPLYFY